MHYSSPPPHFGRELLAPARRAAVMLFILGGLGLLFGMCAGAFVAAAPSAQYDALRQQLGATMGGRIPSEAQVKMMYSIAAALAALAGLVFLALGFFVRRGGKAACVTAVVLCGLALLWLALNEVGGIVGLVSGNMMMAAGACMMLVPIAMFATIVVWLMQVLRNMPKIEAARLQWQTQYQSAQQQQYAHTQYPPPGYGVPPPSYAPPQYGHGYGYVPPGAPASSPQQGQAPAAPGPQERPPDAPPPVG